MNEWPELDERKRRRLIAEHIEELECARPRRPVLEGSPLALFVAERVRWGMPRQESETH